MFTSDFSRAPLQGQAGAVVLAEGRAAAGRADGVTWRRRLRDGSIRFELLTVDTVANAERIAASHPARALVLIAEERGYSNGVWRAEAQTPMAFNEHFHPTASEQREGRTPPRVADRPHRPRRRGADARAPRPRRWSVFDTGSMFLGATRYRHPLAWLVTNRYWWTMVEKMHRMSGTVWHDIYWQVPWTLGTLASYRTRDDMMRFARMPEHRHLMQWIVRDTRNATGGFIRIYSTRAELERQADADGGTASAEGPAPLRLEPVASEADFQEFLAAPRRHEPEALAVPLLEDTVRSWREGTAPTARPVELLLARRGDETVGRTTMHRDAQFDAKLGSPVTLFGATWAATAHDLVELLDAIVARARAEGSPEVFGPASLLPNQTGGVITSGFDERGFLDSPWNPEWVPGAYEAAGFERWHESDTWIARLAPGANAASPAANAASPDAGIRIRRASRLRFARDVRELRRLTNAAFAQLPYYTEISPAQMRAATSGLVALMDPRLWLFAVDEASGRPVAFVLAVPDLTRLLRSSGGRVGARELWRIVRERMRMGAPRAGDAEREAILIIHGCEPSAQGRGIVSRLWRELEANLRDGGYSAIRVTSIGRDNPASARPIERLGGTPLHGHTYYRKRVRP